jgi:hypothetical protein
VTLANEANQTGKRKKERNTVTVFLCCTTKEYRTLYNVIYITHSISNHIHRSVQEFLNMNFSDRSAFVAVTTATTVDTGDESDTDVAVRETCMQCRRSYKNIASARAHWNVKHRAQHGDFPVADPTPAPVPGHKRKHHPFESIESTKKIPKTCIVPCPRCQKTYRNAACHCTHWTQAHTTEHGQYTGRGSGIPVPPPSALPANALDIMKLGPKFFQSCRVNSSGRISIIDAIMVFNDCSRQKAINQWRDIGGRQRTRADMNNLCWSELHEFVGVAQCPTPVATFYQLMELLPQLPGKNSQILRGQQAVLCAWVGAGDPSLVAEIQSRCETLDPKYRTLFMADLDVGVAEQKAARAMQNTKAALEMNLVSHKEVVVPGQKAFEYEQNTVEAVQETAVLRQRHIEYDQNIIKYEQTIKNCEEMISDYQEINRDLHLMTADLEQQAVLAKEETALVVLDRNRWQKQSQKMRGLLAVVEKRLTWSQFVEGSLTQTLTEMRDWHAEANNFGVDISNPEQLEPRNDIDFRVQINSDLRDHFHVLHT